MNVNAHKITMKDGEVEIASVVHVIVWTELDG